MVKVQVATYNSLLRKKFFKHLSIVYAFVLFGDRKMSIELH